MIKTTLIFSLLVCFSNAYLIPRESIARELKDLNGIWNFRLSPHFEPSLGFDNKWYKSPLKKTGDVIPMPVPSSYNDITCNKTIRDHVGWVWYDRNFLVPSHWNDNQTRVVLHFGSAHYTTMVFVNGLSVVNHTGGHLPFKADISKHIKWNVDNLLTVAINNTLTANTIPQGQTIYKDDPSRYPPGYHTQEVYFDFFNYAGIHRPVVLYTTPKAYISDITIRTGLTAQNSGMIHYAIEHTTSNGAGKNSLARCKVIIWDDMDEKVAEMDGCYGDVYIKDAKLWWPVTMHSRPGYLYQMEVHLVATSSLDVYKLPVGIRTLKWDNRSLHINNKPFYFAGFGMHEDADIRGKGVDLPLILRNFNMIKFLRANSFRTSHYPYADEIMDQADRQGIVVIEETPAVSLHFFGKEVLKHHLQALKEMIARDKNRPSVVMWSLANEPRSSKSIAESYFSAVAEMARNLDKSRPITAVLNAPLHEDKAAQFLDIICVNRYFAWYSDVGHLELIQQQVINEYSAWNEKHNKPIMISEYGAGSIVGIHEMPTRLFTEDYHVELLINYHLAFDQLRMKDFFIGEHIWNFADFMTAASLKRVDGNRKGLLTRNRQPKMAAYVIRERYAKLAKKNFNFVGYDAAPTSTLNYWNHTEL